MDDPTEVQTVFPTAALREIGQDFAPLPDLMMTSMSRGSINVSQTARDAITSYGDLQARFLEERTQAGVTIAKLREELRESVERIDYLENR